MNLLEIYEENKKVEKLEKEFMLERELQHIKASIVEGDINYTITEINKDLIDEMGIKSKKISLAFGECKYLFKLNKTNISKIQKYLDERSGINAVEK